MGITSKEIEKTLFYSIHGFYPASDAHIVGGGYDKMAKHIYTIIADLEEDIEMYKREARIFRDKFLAVESLLHNINRGAINNSHTCPACSVINAAAPELLEAGKAILAKESELATRHAWSEYRALEAAIAKSEGRV